MNNCLHILFLLSSILLKAQDPLGNDISGDNQLGEVNTFLKKPIVVRVCDENQRGKSGAIVIFSILAEPEENGVSGRFAKLENDTVITDKDGYAMTKVRLGGGKGNYYILAKHNNESIIFTQIALEKEWLLSLIFSMIGGLALFIFGLNYGSKGLVRGLGGKMRDLLFSLTTNRLIAVLTGIVVTIILGSSTAASVLLVRFAGHGFINLVSALGVMLGADIGTTIAVQILAFNIMDYAIIIVAVGVFLRLLFPDLRNIAQFIFGIGLLFFSLKIMSGATVNLRYMPGFYSAIDYLRDFPVIGILLGAVLAFIFHSSAAVIGIILVLAFKSLISISSALPIVLGANLGTTFFTLFISDTTDGRRVVFGNFIFKLTSVIIFLPFLNYVIDLLKLVGGDLPRQIANFHTFFNVCVTLIFLPLLDTVSRFLTNVIRPSKEDILRARRLDPAFLQTPSIALGQATKEVLQMADTTIKMLEESIKVFENNDIVLRKKIIETDDEIDAVEELVTPYISRLSQEEMDDTANKMQLRLLSVVTELEHIGDIISKNLMTYAKKQIDSGLTFSHEGLSEIKDFHSFVLTTLRMAINSLATRDKKLANETVKRRALGLEQARKLEVSHLLRLSKGLKESLETSTIHLDIISDLERINFHATEIGRAVL